MVTEVWKTSMENKPVGDLYSTVRVGVDGKGMTERKTVKMVV